MRLDHEVLRKKQFHDYKLKILKLIQEKEEITLTYRKQPLHVQDFKDRIIQFETIQQCNSWKADLDKIIKEIEQKKVKYKFSLNSGRRIMCFSFILTGGSSCQRSYAEIQRRFIDLCYLSPQSEERCVSSLRTHLLMFQLFGYSIGLSTLS
jgi:hypothetical protein